MATAAPGHQVSDITQLATDVFEDAAYAVSWLNQPNMATDDRPPIELLRSPKGFKVVENLLLRIRYGVLA